MDCSTSGSSAHGISQAIILKWVVFPSPGDLPDPEIKPESPELAGGFFTIEPSGKHIDMHINRLILFIKCIKASV